MYAHVTDVSHARDWEQCYTGNEFYEIVVEDEAVSFLELSEESWHIIV